MHFYLVLILLLFLSFLVDTVVAETVYVVCSCCLLTPSFIL